MDYTIFLTSGIWFYSKAYRFIFVRFFYLGRFLFLCFFSVFIDLQHYLGHFFSDFLHAY